MPQAKFKTYLATYNALGHVTSLLEAPAHEAEKQRTLIVRAKNAEKAEEVAQALFSLAK